MFETYFIGAEILAVLCFGLGYYVGHRSLAGVGRDLEDIKADVKKLHDYVVPPQVTLQATPVV